MAAASSAPGPGGLTISPATPSECSRTTTPAVCQLPSAGNASSSSWAAAPVYPAGVKPTRNLVLAASENGPSGSNVNVRIHTLLAVPLADPMVISSRGSRMARRIGRLPLPIATPPFTHEAGLHGRRKEAAVESLVLQTAIGLTFIFATFAAAVSAISEAVARYLGLRGEYLLRGVRSAVDGKSDFRLPMRAILPWNAGRLITKNAAGVAKSDPDNDEAMVALIISHPLVAASAKGAAPPCRAGDRAMSNKERRSLPSYLSGQTFSRALVDILMSEVDANRADSHA